MNPSEKIDKAIADCNDWRGQTLAEIRRLTHEALPDVIEEWLWMGSPVFNHNGILFVANAHKAKVKMVFSKGASLPDPEKLFNSELGGNVRRAIQFIEGDKINGGALKKLVLAAAALNAAKPASRRK